jgi:hypothetical protein
LLPPTAFAIARVLYGKFKHGDNPGLDYGLRLEAAAKERQDEGRREGAKLGGRGKKKPSGQMARKETRARDKVAKATGMDARMLAKAEHVVAAAERDPENYGKDLIRASVYIRKRAERRIGELMEEERKAGELKPGRPAKKLVSEKLITSLAERGIDKHLADRARKAAAMSEEKFEVGTGRRVRGKRHR